MMRFMLVVMEDVARCCQGEKIHNDGTIKIIW